jgi:hypothetical protein
MKEWTHVVPAADGGFVATGPATFFGASDGCFEPSFPFNAALTLHSSLFMPFFSGPSGPVFVDVHILSMADFEKDW